MANTMGQCRLVIVEGIPGSGKTTTASFVKDFLDEQDVPNQLYREGDLDHPADFESVAHFSRPEFDSFLADHASYRRLLEQNASGDGEDRFVPYRKLRMESGQAAPDPLIADLAKRDVYETPSASTYCRLAATRWRRFTDEARRVEEVTILETCFLQNPLTVLLGKHNTPMSQALDHIREISNTIQPLHPALIYLRQRDTRATLERVAAERPREWKEFLITYFTQQGWGKATNARGFEGVVTFYEMRQSIELDFIEQSTIDHLIIDTDANNWAQSHDRIAALLRTSLGTVPTVVGQECDR
ncbi:MAG: hypothetical protein MUF84_21065 [Anaerolineae bacterium]|nr:hypothetical protein [Anaerolineae bacterium]